MFKKNSASNTSSGDLAAYCRSVFNEQIQLLKIRKKVHLIPIAVPFSLLNGFTLCLGIRRKTVQLVLINLWPFRFSTKKSLALQNFFLSSVVAHELFHIKIIQDWETGKTEDFQILFSEWAVDHCHERFFPNQLVRRYLSFKEASALRKKRYAVSPIELLCFQYGFQQAFHYCEKSFDEQDLHLSRTILDSIEFINHHLEIDYFSSRQAYNRFTHSLYRLGRSSLQHPDRLKSFPQFSLLFSPKGILKSPVQIFLQRTEQNAGFIDAVLIRLFIALSISWEEIFQQYPAFYQHICKLSNDYCSQAILYIKDMKLGEVFLHRSILQDNAAMLIKNVNILNKLMDEYHIPRTAGSLLPLYYFDDFTKNR